ncbi:uncharacterized protein LOC131143945 [Malania oleifera]|uniref:uncharacterized protein LOC131143945 n=1 Tax=Malania oleifera TaxID=397392 RepID=UPI0025AE4C23|nr:uncharacterized protein LOC131143945 [Malania oleifera]
MEDRYESGNAVWLSVRYWLAKIAEGVKGSMPSIDKNLLEEFQVKMITPKVRTPRKVVWKKPPIGCLKLNIDGSCRENPGSFGGGDIINDSLGNIKAAFFEKFESSTNNGAELQAFTSGVRLYKELGY